MLFYKYTKTTQSNGKYAYNYRLLHI